MTLDITNTTGNTPLLKLNHFGRETGANILAKLEKFMVAEAIGIIIAPQVEFPGTANLWPNGFPPFQPVLHGTAFNNTTSRPAYKGRFKVGKHLGNVFP